MWDNARRVGEKWSYFVFISLTESLWWSQTVPGPWYNKIGEWRTFIGSWRWKSQIIWFRSGTEVHLRKKKSGGMEGRVRERERDPLIRFLLSLLHCFEEILTQSCHVFMRSILIPFRDPESVTCILFCSFRSRSNQMNNRKKRERGKIVRTHEDQNRSQAVVRFRSETKRLTMYTLIFCLLAIRWFINLRFPWWKEVGCFKLFHWFLFAWGMKAAHCLMRPDANYGW